MTEDIFKTEETEESEKVEKVEAVEVDLYDVNLALRPHGEEAPYRPPTFFEEDAKAAEVIRARGENREPDLDNPPPHVGTMLVTEATILASVQANGTNLESPVSTLENTDAVTTVEYPKAD